jgi:myo-inositol-1(or 4)-monophosphatase
MNASYREVAVDAATRAGALLRAHLGGTREVSYKGSPINLVTEMDRRSEALIVEAIQRHFPDHGILAEECGAIGGAGSHRWIVDPLDGTTNYAHGMPIYCVSIALEIEGRVALGVVYDPHRDECFVAERGRGATLNGAPLACRPRRRSARACSARATSTTSGARAATTWPSMPRSCSARTASARSARPC